MPALLTDSTPRHGHLTKPGGEEMQEAICQLLFVVERAGICVSGDELRMIALAMITQTDQDGDAPKKAL
jgi:hypothetical protein